MHGVSALIAILMLLLVSVGLTVTTYRLLTTTQTEAFYGVETQQQIQQRALGSQLTVVSVEPSETPTIKVQNTGKYELTNFVVYVDDSVVTPISVPDRLAPGDIGTIVLPAVSQGIHDVKITTNLAKAATSMEYSIEMDKTSPTTSAYCQLIGNVCYILLNCTDTGSGCAVTKYCLDNTATCTPNIVYTGLINSTGNTYVRFNSTDVAGNIEPIRSEAIAHLPILPGEPY